MTPPVVFNSFPLPVTNLTAVEPPRDRRRVASLYFRDCTAVVLGSHGGDGGATAGGAQWWWSCYCGGTAVMEVLLRSLYGATAVMAVPWRPHYGLAQPADVLKMFKVSAVPPRTSAVLTVFGGATVINGGTTPEPRRSWRCHCGLCRTSTAVASRLRCDGGTTAEARRNMLNVSAVPPRRSVVFDSFPRCYGDQWRNHCGTTAEPLRNHCGTTAEPRRSWRCHCGLCRTSTAVAPGLRCDGGITWESYYYRILTTFIRSGCFLVNWAMMASISTSTW